jgi:hypothetical protein
MARQKTTTGKKSVRVPTPIEVTWKPCWLSWVSATTACLKALGVECDHVDVAGYSGYAFHLTVHEGMCPSGPTVLSWWHLQSGPRSLGRSTMMFNGECYNRDARTDETEAQCRYALELVRRETEAGRPCVIWGAPVPEFAVAVGVHGDQYVYVGCPEGGKARTVSYDALLAPGGVTVLAMPTPMSVPETADAGAICQAIETMRWRIQERRYSSGVDAYDRWQEALRGKVYDSKQFSAFGNSYNAQCWSTARTLARDFIARLVEELPPARDPLERASEAFGSCAEHLQKVAELFPFHGPVETQVPDEASREKACDHLAAARESDAAALDALDDAAGLLAG